MSSIGRSKEGKIKGAGFIRTKAQYRSVPISLEDSPENSDVKTGGNIKTHEDQNFSVKEAAPICASPERIIPIRVEKSGETSEPLNSRFNFDFGKNVGSQTSLWIPKGQMHKDIIGEVLDHQRQYKIRDVTKLTDDIFEVKVKVKVPSIKDDVYFCILVSKKEDLDSQDNKKLSGDCDGHEEKENFTFCEKDSIPKFYESFPNSNLKSCLKRTGKSKRSPRYGAIYINPKQETNELSFKPKVNFDQYHIVKFYLKRDEEWKTYHPYEVFGAEQGEGNIGPNLSNSSDEQDPIYEVFDFNKNECSIASTDIDSLSNDLDKILEDMKDMIEPDITEEIMENTDKHNENDNTPRIQYDESSMNKGHNCDKINAKQKLIICKELKNENVHIDCTLKESLNKFNKYSKKEKAIQKLKECVII